MRSSDPPWMYLLRDAAFRHAVLVVLLGCVGALGGVGAAWLLPQRYEARAVIRVGVVDGHPVVDPATAALIVNRRDTVARARARADAPDGAVVARALYRSHLVEVVGRAGDADRAEKMASAAAQMQVEHQDDLMRQMAIDADPSPSELATESAPVREGFRPALVVSRPSAGPAGASTSSLAAAGVGLGLGLGLLIAGLRESRRAAAGSDP